MKGGGSHRPAARQSGLRGVSVGGQSSGRPGARADPTRKGPKCDRCKSKPMQAIRDGSRNVEAEEGEGVDRCLVDGLFSNLVERELCAVSWRGSEPKELLCAVSSRMNEPKKWRAGVNSRVAVSGGPSEGPEGLPELPVGPDGKRVVCSTANRQLVPDEGMQVVRGRSRGVGSTLVHRFEVAKVSRPLISVSEGVEKGVRSTFDQRERVNCSTAEVMESSRVIDSGLENSVYVRPLSVRTSLSWGFPRQGVRP